MVKQLLYFVLFVALMTAVSGVLASFDMTSHLFSPDFWLVFVFFALVTFVAYATALVGIKQAKEAGVMVIMVAFFVKLLSSLVFVLIYSKKHDEVELRFIFNFFILYLLFSLFEILGLLRNLRHQNLK